MKKFLNEFKDFAMKGNVIDMAVGVVIANAFNAIVSSLVNDIIMPLVSLLIGSVNFTELSAVIERGVDSAGEPILVTIAYGTFIQNIVDFLIVALCLFAAIKLINSFHKKEEEPAPAPEEPKLSDEAQLLTEIKELLEKEAAK